MKIKLAHKSYVRQFICSRNEILIINRLVNFACNQTIRARLNKVITKLKKLTRTFVVKTSEKGQIQYLRVAILT